MPTPEPDTRSERRKALDEQLANAPHLPLPEATPCDLPRPLEVYFGLQVSRSDLPIPMLGQRLPSITGKVVYEVVAVEPGQHVTLRSPGRRGDSVLPWVDIARVYDAALAGETITPTAVDRILGNPFNHNNSTMCALVLAMKDPGRVRCR